PTTRHDTGVTTMKSIEPIEDRIRRAEVLVEALPYIRRFAGHTVVVKLGGAAIEGGNPEAVLQDVVLLRFVGMRPVLVHGGGPASHVSAGSVAAVLAVALRATKLLLLTDVDGVLDADSSLISELDRSRANRLIASGVISGGMIPKVMAAVRALDGASAAHII